MRYLEPIVIIILLLSMAFADTTVTAVQVGVQRTPYDLEQIVAGASPQLQTDEYDKQPVISSQYFGDQTGPRVIVDVNISPSTVLPGYIDIYWHVRLSDGNACPYYIRIYGLNTFHTYHEAHLSSPTGFRRIFAPDEIGIIVIAQSVDIGPKMPPSVARLYSTNIVPLVARRPGIFKVSVLGYAVGEVHADFGSRTYSVVLPVSGGTPIGVLLR